MSVYSGSPKEDVGGECEEEEHGDGHLDIVDARFPGLGDIPKDPHKGREERSAGLVLVVVVIRASAIFFWWKSDLANTQRQTNEKARSKTYIETLLAAGFLANPGLIEAAAAANCCSTSGRPDPAGATADNDDDAAVDEALAPDGPNEEDKGKEGSVDDDGIDGTDREGTAIDVGGADDGG